MSAAWFALFCGVAIVVVIFLIVRGTREPLDVLLDGGRLALAEQDFGRAEDYASRALGCDPHSPGALLLAARTAAAQGKLDAALFYYQQVPDDGSPEAAAARTETGDLYLFQFHRLSDAEQEFRRALAQDETQAAAHNRLAYLLGLQSRTRESVPHRLAVLRSGRFDVTDVYLLSLGERAMDDPDTIAAYYRAAPDDPAAQLALARVVFEEKRNRAAEQLLRQAAASPRHAVEAQARLGRLLLERDDAEAFLAWHRELSAAIADASAAVWAIRAEWASRREDSETAVRCYWEAVQRDPHDVLVNYHLGQRLVSLGQPSEAEPFLERAQQLEQYARAAELAWHVGESRDFRRAAETAEALELVWEAWGWSRLALDLGPRAEWALEAVGRLEPLVQELPLTRAAADRNPADVVDLSRFPLPQWDASPGARRAGAAAGAAGQGGRVDREARTGIRFEDRAEASGLHFRYQNGGDPAQGLVRMYEVTGGGVAVLDYDGDGWPDLYLPQGGTWPPGEGTGPETDRLFRNLGGERFQDITALAGFDEAGFGTGAGVGDFDNDGFPDVYVANIGGNRLYRNNGDGTFTDVTSAAAVEGDDYSACALIADLNGNGLPDVYVVNYLEGDDLFERVCGGNDGVPRSCLPQSFPAAADRLYLNLGDGRFEEATAAAGMAVPPGKGLGVIAADLGDGRLSVFVANDVGPNFLFVNTAPRGSFPAFVERGLAAGVALNNVGRYESGMGAAAADVDGDGRLDLFVTNFEQESNTLYKQLAPPRSADGPGGTAGTRAFPVQFLDATAEAGLDRHSLPLVGWGTQFVDGGLDGRPDLLIANGHVNNLLDHGKPYRMPPQYLENLGDGRFVELPAESLGPYFAGEYLGRGMARLDWNRDGREDVAISHLDRPVALLTNVTRPVGHVLTVRLRGIRSDRDAMGATVTAIYSEGPEFRESAGNGQGGGTRRLVRQLTAGDGNQSSNERLLVFGLGACDRVDRLHVRWPSGEEQELRDVRANQELLIVEGRSRSVRLRTYDARTAAAAYESKLPAP